MTQTINSTENEERRLARKRLIDRRDFVSHLIAYAVVNGFVVFVWAITGAGYFWPAWLIGLWGIGLVLHGIDTFFRRPITEDDVDEELHRHVSQ
jgi:hypothetical protein